MRTDFKNEAEMCDFEIVSTTGNTLFDSLAFIVWESEKHSQQMRIMIVNRLRVFPQKYNVNGKSIQEFEK